MPCVTERLAMHPAAMHVYVVQDLYVQPAKYILSTSSRLKLAVCMSAYSNSGARQQALLTQLLYMQSGAFHTLR